MESQETPGPGAERCRGAAIGRGGGLGGVGVEKGLVPSVHGDVETARLAGKAEVGTLSSLI